MPSLHCSANFCAQGSLIFFSPQASTWSEGRRHRYNSWNGIGPKFGTMKQSTFKIAMPDRLLGVPRNIKVFHDRIEPDLRGKVTALSTDCRYQPEISCAQYHEACYHLNCMYSAIFCAFMEVWIFCVCVLQLSMDEDCSLNVLFAGTCDCNERANAIFNQAHALSPESIYRIWYYP